MHTDAIIKRNNINVFGSGPRTVVMSHGFGTDQRMFRYILPYFEKNYKVVLFDHVGCGKSDLAAYSSDKYQDLEGYAEDLLQIFKALNLSDVYYVGHSISGTIGVLAYLQRPQLFKKMVFICPSPRYINEGDYYGGFESNDVEELLEVMNNNFDGWAAYLAPIVIRVDNPKLVQEFEMSLKQIEPLITRQFAKATFYSDIRAELPKLDLPVLILQCTDDDIAPVEVGEYMQSQIIGSRLIVMKATGHCPQLTHPDETAEAICALL